jgi:hypothetical protein
MVFLFESPPKIASDKSVGSAVVDLVAALDVASGLITFCFFFEALEDFFFFFFFLGASATLYMVQI